MIFGLVLGQIACFVMMTTNSYSMLIYSQFINGLMTTVRVQVCVIYMLENMTERSISSTITTFFSLETCCALFGSFYFIWISKESYYLLLLGNILQGLGTLMLFCVPESPKWLIKTGKMQEAQKVLEQIGRNNKSDNIASVSKECFEELFGKQQT